MSFARKFILRASALFAAAAILAFTASAEGASDKEGKEVRPEQQSPRLPTNTTKAPLTVVFTHSLNWSQGDAHVVSSPPGISCPENCSANFDQGFDVVFTATADQNSIIREMRCWAIAGQTAPLKPGNTMRCVYPGMYAASGGGIAIEVDAAGSGQQRVITGNGLPPANANANSNTDTNGPAPTFPNETGGGNTGTTGSGGPSHGSTGSDFVDGTNMSGGNGPPAIACTGAHTQCVSPLASNCIAQFWDPKNFGWLSFQNNCGQTVVLQWISLNGTGTWGGAGGAATLKPGGIVNTGQSRSEVNAAGGGYSLYVCPPGFSAVDAGGRGVRGPGLSYTCKKV